MAEQSTYPSTKFVVLTDSESIANAKKNYLTWIISGTILFGITVGFLCHKIFVAPTFFNDTLTQSPEYTTQQPTEIRSPKTSEIILPHSDAMFRRRLSKDQSDFLCNEFTPQSEAVPVILRKRILEKPHFEEVKDLINAELLIHYENIINEYDWRYLKSLFNEYNLKLLEVKTSADFMNFLNGLKSNKFKFYIKHLKTQKFELNLKDFDWFFSLTEELNHWYNYLSRLGTYMSGYDQQIIKKSLRNITETTFSKFTGETYRKLFHFVYPFSVTEKKLLELNEIINEWGKPMEVEIKKCSVTLFNRAVLLSEVREVVSSLKGCIENVYVFASRIIYLDSDLELFGVNLAIISPEWKFLKKVIINLNGTAGESHPNATGRDGKPGNPGGNGGDFLAVGDFEETFMAVFTTGGVGGTGQNGAKGRDGVDNSRPDLRLDKPGCVIKVKKFSNLVRLNITYYEIYGEDGCGGPGTNGGVGGYGGLGGVITLLKKDGVNITKGLNGAPGRPGKGGVGGTGGRDGCFYEAVDENDEFLHPVTTVKCLIGNELPSGQAGKDGYNDLGLILPSPKKNLLVHDAVIHYIRLSEQHFVKYNDPSVSFLRTLHIPQKIENALEEYKLIEGFERLEYYQFFNEFLQDFHISENKTLSLVNYLKSITLGKITYLMNNVKYFFVDWKSYLNIIETSIKNNETKLEAVDYFKRKVHVKIDEIQQTLKLLKEKSKTPARGRKPETLPNRHSCIMTITTEIITYFLNDEFSSDLNNTWNLCSQIISVKNDPTNAEQFLLKTFQSILFKNKPERECLAELRDALDSLKDSHTLPEEKKYSLQALLDEVEHFTALYYFVKWERVENLFSRSLENITRDESENQSDEIAFLRDRLKDTLVSVQIKLAEDSTTQNLYSTLQPLRKTLGDVVNLSNGSRDRSPFCNNHVKAIFERNSTIGPFFSWPNGEIKNKLKVLFSGAKINLKADLVNRHVLDKSLVQFASLRLEFNCVGEETSCGKLQDVLTNFKIDLTHSGYSYYNWRDETRIVVSEKVTLSYNFKTRGNQPELYNAFFKKCQEGEIRLSPFTTWTVQLVPLNEDANFKELAQFADYISLHLIGTGTYTVGSS